MEGVSRREPPTYSCLKRPELKAVCARMVEEAGALLDDVALHIDLFRERFEFPEVVFQDLHRFRHAYDAFIREMILRVPLRVRCRKGCSVCCVELPCGVEPLETLEIYRTVSTWPDFDEVMRECAAAMKAFQTVCREVEGETGVGVRPGSRTYGLALNRYVFLKRPCVFLEKNEGLCRIYRIRPLICRAVFSISDPALCDPDHPDFGTERHRVEALEPVDEVNVLLLQINALISEAAGVRFPEILPHALLFCHRRTRETVSPPSVAAQ